MLEELHEKSQNFMESVHEKTQAVSDSFTSLGEDLQDIRDIFVETRDTIGGIFGFMGKETALLLLFTFLFLFVVNLIPFFFFDKKTRYYVGMAFGVFLGFYFDYAYFAIGKFVFIMLIPVAFEYLMVSTFKGAKSLIVGTFKRAGSFAWSLVKFPFKALFAKRAVATCGFTNKMLTVAAQLAPRFLTRMVSRAMLDQLNRPPKKEDKKPEQSA